MNTEPVSVEHDHDFGDPREAAIGAIRPCAVPDCTEWVARHRGRVAWEPLTADETIALTAHLIEATAIGEAMVMIHGRERGLRRARQVLGYDD